MKLSIFGVLTLLLLLLLPLQPITAQAECSSLTVDWPVTVDHAPTAFGYTAQRNPPAGSPTALSVHQDGKDVPLFAISNCQPLSEVNGNFIAGIDISTPQPIIGSHLTTSTLTGNGNRIIYAYQAPGILVDKSAIFHRLTFPDYVETNDCGVKTIWSDSRPKAVQYDKVPYYDLNTVGNLYLLSDDIRLIDKGDDAVLMNSESGDCYNVCSRSGDSEALPWFASKIKDYTVLFIDDHYATIVFTLE